MPAEPRQSLGERTCDGCAEVHECWMEPITEAYLCASCRIGRLPGFSDFAEPFCTGWNAHAREGDVDDEAFVKILMDAYNNSGAMCAYRTVEAMLAEGGDDAR